MNIALALPVRLYLTRPDVLSSLTVFPFLPGQKYLTKKAPAWSTIVQQSASGRRSTVALMSAPLWKFETSFEFLRKKLTADEWAVLVEFFNYHRGKYSSWSYYDPTDHLVDDQEFGIGNGTTDIFQLKRAVRAWTEPVYAVDAITRLTVNGVLTSAYTLLGNGRVQFDTPPANNAVLRWTGSFMFLCEFETDQLDMARIFSGHWDTESLQWTSIKP